MAAAAHADTDEHKSTTGGRAGAGERVEGPASGLGRSGGEAKCARAVDLNEKNEGGRGWTRGRQRAEVDCAAWQWHSESQPDRARHVSPEFLGSDFGQQHHARARE